jgi:hypothetical protein
LDSAVDLQDQAVAAFPKGLKLKFADIEVGFDMAPLSEPTGHIIVSQRT